MDKISVFSHSLQRKPPVIDWWTALMLNMAPAKQETIRQQARQCIRQKGKMHCRPICLDSIQLQTYLIGHLTPPRSVTANALLRLL